MTRTIERPKVEKATAPARGWRNRIWIARGGKDDWGRKYRKGLNIGHVWPSKDIAETRALVAIKSPYWVERGIKYLGAFQVSE